MTVPTTPPTPEERPREGWLPKWRRFAATDTRTHFWNLLDYFEAHPAVRRSLAFGLPAILVIVAGGYWGYARWERVNSTKIARQWLDANRLDRAGAAVQEAIAFAPKSPEPWRLASELAWRRGQKAASVEYAKHAAEVSDFANEEVVAWGEAAVLAGEIDETGRALSYLSHDEIDQSARASRLAGELARQKHDYPAARDHFEKALQDDTAAGVDTLANDEVPLGLCLLTLPDKAQRDRGISLLSKWTREINWGAEALRALLADAIERNDKQAMVRWAVQLRAHPHCSVGDLPQCLLATSRADEASFQAMLAALETICAPNTTRSAELVGWLSSMGRPEDALEWIKTLKAPETHQPPLVVAVAEALRSAKHWTDLAAWTATGDWGQTADFLRLAYRFTAAENLGDTPLADSLWSTIQGIAASNGGRGLFLADTLYTWGDRDKAVGLLWSITADTQVGIQALGTLARHYQVEADAHGQYRVFAKLYSLRPNDAAITNNYVFFSVLSKDGDLVTAERLAKENYTRDPKNTAYLATYAYLLAITNRPSAALAILAPVEGDWRKNGAIAYAYAIALGGAGRKDDAQKVVDTIDPRPLSPEEKAQLSAAVH